MNTDTLALLRRRDGLFATDLLIVALGKLDLVNWIAARCAGCAPPDAASIGHELGLAARPTDVLLTLLVAMGLLDRARDGTVRLTPFAKDCLTRGSPRDLTAYLASLNSRPIHEQILQVLRTGRPFGWASNPDEREWSHAMDDPRFAVRFTAAMDSRGAHLAQAMAQALDCTGRRRVLDIAGASGVYACAIVDAHPGLHATVLEKPPVDRITRLILERRGRRDDIEVAACDMFADPLPPDHDVHVFSHVLHDWAPDRVRELLRRSFAALAPGGLLVVHDAHLDPDGRGPLAVAEYSVLLMLSTEGKCYSVTEMAEMMREIGFRWILHTPTEGDRSIITAIKPG